MTREQLIGYGYVPQLCRVGTLYYKNPFFCSLNEETGEIDFRYEFDELNTVGIYSTLKELGIAEKKYYESTAEYFDGLAKAYKQLVNNYIVPEE